MRLYNKKTNSVENITQYRGSDRIVYILEKLSEKELNALGLYNIAVVPNPMVIPSNQRVEIQPGKLIANKWVNEKVLIDIPIEDLCSKKKLELSIYFNSISRPRIPLTLEDGTSIFIDGSREDKDNFKEEYERMYRHKEVVGEIVDADNNHHSCTIVDIQNGYHAIVDNYSPLMKGKWKIKKAIKAIATNPELTYKEAVAQLDMITW